MPTEGALGHAMSAFRQRHVRREDNQAVIVRQSGIWVKRNQCVQNCQLPVCHLIGMAGSAQVARQISFVDMSHLRRDPHRLCLLDQTSRHRPLPKGRRCNVFHMLSRDKLFHPSDSMPVDNGQLKAIEMEMINHKFRPLGTSVLEVYFLYVLSFSCLLVAAPRLSRLTRDYSSWMVCQR